MKKKFLLVFLYLFCVCFTENEILSFRKRHYVKSDTNKKVIEVSSSIPNNEFTLKINNIAKKEITECSPKEKDLTIFYCFISSYGEYKFDCDNGKYNCDQSIFVYSSYEELFKITPLRETDCLFHKESFSYTVEINEENPNSIDLNNIQIFAYSPKSIVKQINSTEVINFTREISDDGKKAKFTINPYHTRNQYIVRITENEDYDDTLGKIQSFSFTEVEIHDNYFFPSLHKIRVYSDFCNFEPDSLILKNGIEKFKLTCNKKSKFYFSKYFYCYFDETITKYGKMDLYFQNVLLKENILSLRPMDQLSFDVSVINDEPHKEVTFIIKDGNGDEFTLDAINKFHVENKDDFETKMIIFYIGFNLYYYKNDDRLSVTFKYLKGIHYTGIKLERKLYEDENLENAKELYYIFDSSSKLSYYEELDQLTINDLFVVGDLTENYFRKLFQKREFKFHFRRSKKFIWI